MSLRTAGVQQRSMTRNRNPAARATERASTICADARQQHAAGEPVRAREPARARSVRSNDRATATMMTMRQTFSTTAVNANAAKR